jgi:hypothetical protein
MTKYRIQKETIPQEKWDDEITYVIQEKHWYLPLYRDSYQFCWYYYALRNFGTLKEAQEALKELTTPKKIPKRITV